MKTLTIGTYQMPITDNLEQAFLEYYAYYSLPLEVQLRIDPKAKQSQWLWDDMRSALYDAWIEFLENSDITDQEFDVLEELLSDQDDDEICEQLEQVLELNLEAAE
jgi:hypothetical protein